MESKYDPLGKHLESISPQTNDLTLSFHSIEQILAFSLPNSAFNHKAWWAYEVHPRHPHKIIWQNAGWRVEEVDLTRRQVRFRRLSSQLLQVKTESKKFPDAEVISLPKLITSNPVRTVPNLSLIIQNAAWSPVFGIPQGTLLPKGRHGLYPEITRSATAVQNRFG